MSFLEQLFFQIALPATVIAILGYLGRSLISQLLTRDLDRHKSQLSRELEIEKHTLTRELEQLKREWDAQNLERQTRFSLMHQKRAEVIGELYGRVFDAEQAISAMTAIMRMESRDQEVEKERRHQERKVAADAFNALHGYFRRNRIYLSPQTAQRCEELVTKMKQAFFGFDYSQGIYTQGQQDPLKWAEAWRQISEDVPPIREKLEEDFRAELGVRN